MKRQGEYAMEKDKTNKVPEGKEEQPEGPKSEEWYTDALEELDDFIESQGIYIRQ